MFISDITNTTASNTILPHRLNPQDSVQTGTKQAVVITQNREQRRAIAIISARGRRRFRMGMQYQVYFK